MSHPKKRPPTLKTKPKEQVNKKALVWIISSFAVLVILMAVLLLTT
ncbi:hypothetical protein FHS18_002039 [Paenibacillus phyllosphaerae]|uniref:Uncharacterized protein n=1 Tax=Paenibacillus phyllosphaerae TaxID=274593 RepID=A0A7W5FM74_9BACL|nr:hypothetical protein [Paenibacillus phyllosphaerae]MBB3109976.1 hypothetical protein [Paenibacillus phyllosphaerae]